MTEKTRGVVKWYDSTKGYGFIKVEGEAKDIFFHAKQWNTIGKGTLPVDGEVLHFVVNQGEKGPYAVDIQRSTNASRF